jgi:heptosyltransferase-2
MAQLDCRYFNGYKPCGKGLTCEPTCPSYAPIGTRVLVVHLEALGAVLRSTSLLAAIRRRYRQAHITWVTKAPAQALLAGLDEIDRLLTLHPDDVLKLSNLHFDVALVIDKSLVASGLVKHCQVGQTKGFVADSMHGAIVPANPEAHELWNLGLSDTRKFFVNQKTEQRLIHESLALGEYRKDEYLVRLSESEQTQSRQRREQWSNRGVPLIGINTGCSGVLPHKKLSVEGHRELIQRILQQPSLKKCRLVLLGGAEDRERNEVIAHGLPVIQSPLLNGLRDGLISVAACDLVFSGDSLGMHMAIGLKKWVVAWFGPSCQQEIELYGRGRKILTEAPCSPCWKRVCQQPRMCYDQVDFNACAYALEEGLQWLISSSKPRSPEISSSPSP